MIGFMYYRDRLAGNAKDVYDILVEGMRYRCGEIPVPGYSVNGDALSQIVEAIEADHPELFYVDFKHYQYSTSAVHFNLYYEIREIETLEGKLAEKINLVRAWIAERRPRDEYERYLLLHDYFVLHNRYNNAVYSGKSDIEDYTLIGPLVHNQAVCEGISEAYKFMCDFVLGQECICVSGESNKNRSSEPHGWNIVKIRGAYYHVDVTWDMTLSEGDDFIRHDYFALSDYEALQDHRMYEIGIHCDSLSDNYFARSGTMFSDWRAVGPYFGQMLARGESTFYFKISAASVPGNIDDLVLDMLDSEFRARSNDGYHVNYSINHEQLVYKITIR